MKKLIKFVDNSLLKYWIGFLILFIPLYPKLPSIGIPHTWVYIRLEDFFIAALAIFFIVQTLRKKTKFYLPLEIPIILYWVIGLISLLFSIIVIAPTLANFFPHVAILSYFRRIEYMILFIIGLASVKNEKDLKFYFWILVFTNIGILIYGLGQRYYIDFWQKFPKFFEAYPFCFPSFQTTNEEFAKGVPLCLPQTGRITSLFGGHYDLAAYLVMVIPIIFSVAVNFKNNFKKLLLIILGFGLVYILILTASRISFAAYLIGVIPALILLRKKKFIIPIILISIILLASSSSSALERFSKTIRFTNIVINNQGQVVGETESSLPPELRKKISKKPLVVALPPPTEELPTGTSYISLPVKPVATTGAVVRSKASLTENQKPDYRFGAVEISTISGAFLIQKALVYDISFTTRFQSEWPKAWNAFMKNKLLGTGYSSITLATDNSFLRSLGETGILGFVSFISFLLLFFIFIKNYAFESSTFTKSFIIGIAGGLMGLIFNALMIDVFEASKVAENLWMLLGVASGAVLLTKRKELNYIEQIKKIFISHVFICIYILILFFIFFSSSIPHFFVADDFTWLYWSATSDISSIWKNFIDAGNFFYRPIDKILFFLTYTFFGFKSSSYHIFNIVLNSLAAGFAYLLLYATFKKKTLAFLGAIIFAFLPSHGPNIFWISTISTTISTVFILGGLLLFYLYRNRSSISYYLLSLMLFSFSVLSYEGASIFILLVLLIDLVLVKKVTKHFWFSYVPLLFIEIGYFYLRNISYAAGFSGDYSYNLSKILPNFIGNFLGYTSLFFMGSYTLPFYTLIRNGLKTYSLILNIIGVILIFAVFFFLFKKKLNLNFLKKFRLELFGLTFAFISLLPFLGLGNMTERYIFLPSFGFVVFVVAIIQKLSKNIKGKRNSAFAFLILIFIVVMLLYREDKKIESHWNKASEISYFTLAKFKLDYIVIPKYSNIYFVNLPIAYGQAYVFPVGLKDALWFIYRDPTLNIKNVSTLEEAKKLKQKAEETTVVNNYIFLFDKKYQIGEVKE